LRFSTEFGDTDRHTKGEYVWRKYEEILRGASILDVGGEESPIRQFLDTDASYWSIGLGGKPDQAYDLEAGKLPFETDSYDCVLCLDVLEHLECIHAMFHELCRVSRRYVVISLPSPWNVFLAMMRSTDWRPEQPIEFYGLPPEPPQDRYRWFFSAREARRFVEVNAEKTGARILQLDSQGRGLRLGWLERMAARVLSTRHNSFR
jgi:hypothetical protein